MAGVSKAGDGKRLQLSGPVRVVELGCGKKSCWPVGSMAGSPNDEHPDCDSRHKLVSKRKSVTRSDRTTLVQSTKRIAAVASKRCNDSPIDSVWEFRLGATIPFRLGNIPGCLWLIRLASMVKRANRNLMASNLASHWSRLGRALSPSRSVTKRNPTPRPYHRN